MITNAGRDLDSHTDLVNELVRLARNPEELPATTEVHLGAIVRSLAETATARHERPIHVASTATQPIRCVEPLVTRDSPALLEGEHYEITIAEGWRAVNDSSVLPAFSKHFSVVKALREQPNVKRWTSRLPRVGTREPLLVTFDRPFDRHLLDGALHAVDSAGQTIDGAAIVCKNELSWSFTPHEPWAAPGMHIAVDNTLEDVAGNNLHELLDRPVKSRRTA